MEESSDGRVRHEEILGGAAHDSSIMQEAACQLSRGEAWKEMMSIEARAQSDSVQCGTEAHLIRALPDLKRVLHLQ